MELRETLLQNGGGNLPDFSRHCRIRQFDDEYCEAGGGVEPDVGAGGIEMLSPAGESLFPAKRGRRGSSLGFGNVSVSMTYELTETVLSAIRSSSGAPPVGKRRE